MIGIVFDDGFKKFVIGDVECDVFVVKYYGRFEVFKI